MNLFRMIFYSWAIRPHHLRPNVSNRRYGIIHTMLDNVAPLLSQKSRNNNNTLPSHQLEIYPKLGPLFGKELSTSNVAPAFEIPTPPATPQKQKPIGKSSNHYLSPNALVRLDNQLSAVTKPNTTPKSTSITSNSDSPSVNDMEALSLLINKRSRRGRKFGVCKDSENPLVKSVDKETSDKENEFFRKLPSQIPRIVLLGPAAIFQNGQSLKSYQAVDLAMQRTW